MNDRNYLDVVFAPPTTPSGLTINDGSITDFEPEFTLTGSGIGSIVVDSSRAPVHLTDLDQDGSKTFRFWLSGRFADAGEVTLTYLPNTWSFNVQIPAAVATVTLPNPTLTVTLPAAPEGQSISDATVNGDEIEIAAQYNPETGEQLTGGDRWEVTLGVPVKVSDRVFQYPLVLVVPENSTLAAIELRYWFVDGSWSTQPTTGGSMTPVSLPGRTTTVQTSNPILDVTFPGTPNGQKVVGTSVTDADPEFDLLAVYDGATGQPVSASLSGTPQLQVDGVTYRYSLAFPAGTQVPATLRVRYAFKSGSWTTSPDGSGSGSDVVLSPDPGIVSSEISRPQTLALGGAEPYLTVVFPKPPGSQDIDVDSITDTGSNDFPQLSKVFEQLNPLTGTDVTGTADAWVITFDDSKPVTRASDSSSQIFRFPLKITVGDSRLSRIKVRYTFVSGTWKANGAVVTFTGTETGEQVLNLGDVVPSTIRVTLPSGPAGFELDAATVTDATAEFTITDTDPNQAGIQIGSDPPSDSHISGKWTIALDPNRDPVRLGDSNEFDFPVLITLPRNSNAYPSVQAEITFVQDSWAYTGPTTGGTQGGDTLTLTGLAATNNRTFIDVTYRGSAGRALDAGSITDAPQEFAFSGFGAANVRFAIGNHSLFDLSDGDPTAHERTFRYLLEGDFQPGVVEAVFVEDGWLDAAAQDSQGNPLPIHGSRASTQSFLVQGTSADLVNTVAVPVLDDEGKPTGETTEGVVTLDGGAIGRDFINSRRYLEITFRPTEGNVLDFDSINGDEMEVRGPDGNLVVLTGNPMRVGLSTTYRYGFSGVLASGLYTVLIKSGTVTDSAGIVNQSETESFRIQDPTAVIANPTPDGVARREDLNSRTYVDITFNPVQGKDAAVGQEVDPATILDAAPEFTLTGSDGDALVIDPSPVRLKDASGALSNTYRYFLSGKFSDAELTAANFTFLVGAWKDVNGNPVSEDQLQGHVPGAPAVNLEQDLTADKLRGRLWLDVTYTPTAGADVDPASVLDGGAEFTLTGAGTENLVTDTVLQVNKTTFRYLFRGQVDTGTVTVAFLAGTWTDTAGNSVIGSSDVFHLITQSESYFIELSGGVQLNALGFLDEPLLELKAEVILELDFDRDVFTLDFNGQLKIIKLGTVGSTAGRFVLDTSNTLSDSPQFWGVATLETNFTTLEQYGVFLFAKGTLQVNTTESRKTETLTLKGIGDNGADVMRTFVLAPLSFSLELVGQARVRAPGTDTDLFRLQGGFFLSINPERFELYVTAELSFGIGDTQVTYGKATGLLIIETGEAEGRNPGVAGLLKASASAALGLPSLGSLFSIQGCVQVMFNTTLQDQSFKIPSAFLPLLGPGDPTVIEIYASAPGLDGMRNPNAPASGEVYVVASIQAEITIGGVITLTGFVQVEFAAGPASGAGGTPGARLKLTGLLSTEIAFLGSLSATLNLNLFIGPNPGVVGRVLLTLASNSLPGVALERPVPAGVEHLCLQQDDRDVQAEGRRPKWQELFRRFRTGWGWPARGDPGGNHRDRRVPSAVRR